MPFLWGSDSEVPTLPSNNEGVVVYKSGNWSTVESPLGTWLRYDSDTGTWVESTGADAQPKSDEIVVIGKETASNTVYQIEGKNTSTSVDSIFFVSSGTDMAARSINLRFGNDGNYETPALKITKDFVVENTSTVGNLTVSLVPRGTLSDNRYRITNFEIGGNVYLGTDTAVKSSFINFGTQGDITKTNAGPLSKLRIGGDIYVRETSLATNQMHFNVGATHYADVKGGIIYDITKPDVEIGGAIHVVGNQRSFFYMMRNDGAARVCTFSVGGLDGNFSFLLANGTPTDYNDGENVNYFVLVLTQGAGITYTHHTIPELGATIAENGDNNFDAANVMKIVMQGEGTQILKSGTLRFHGGVEVNNGTLLVNGKADGADGLALDKTTVWTHGDLDMKGGTFGMYNNTAGAGIFTFTNCYWKDGTIQLGTYDDGVDVLSFSGAFMEGAGEVSDVWFSFDGDCSALLEQRKLIDCSEFSSYFTADKFKADDAFIFGEMYKAQFEIKDDGLYMQYVAVPEPAEIAALLGLCACLIAFAKRGRSA